jgi:hypothetical protein
VNAALRLAYRRIPSFRREHGGLYALYVPVIARIHSTRMRRLHDRGRHGPAPHGYCQWCGQPIGGPR